MSDLKPHYPLSALVGQDHAVLALTLLAVDPSIGGLLIRGPRGTAKSTMARGLADHLSEGHFVDLPLGADEEKLVGSLNLDAALSEQKLRYEPGLMARADQGVLYVDEVNLLADHLVDLLLDVAASGVNRLERDGISHQHHARFVLVGTMNPDEGELRPQLLDRFGLCVDLETPNQARMRAEVIRRRMAFSRDANAFAQAYSESEKDYAQRLVIARDKVHSVNFDEAIDLIAEACSGLNLDGLRGDLAWLYAARAHAAWRSSQKVEAQDIEATKTMSLVHRIAEQADQAPPQQQAPPPPPSQRRPQSSENQNQGVAGQANQQRLSAVSNATQIEAIDEKKSSAAPRGPLS